MKTHSNGMSFLCAGKYLPCCHSVCVFALLFKAYQCGNSAIGNKGSQPNHSGLTQKQVLEIARFA